jgi:UDP-glucose 4-epimerase
VASQLLTRQINVVGIDSVVHAGNLRDLAGRISVQQVVIQDLARLPRVVTEEEVARIIHLAAAISDQEDT